MVFLCILEKFAGMFKVGTEYLKLSLKIIMGLEMIVNLSRDLGSGSLRDLVFAEVNRFAASNGTWLRCWHSRP